MEMDCRQQAAFWDMIVDGSNLLKVHMHEILEFVFHIFLASFN